MFLLQSFMNKLSFMTYIYVLYLHTVSKNVQVNQYSLKHFP